MSKYECVIIYDSRIENYEILIIILSIRKNFAERRIQENV